MKVICIAQVYSSLEVGTVYDVFLDVELEPYIIDDFGGQFYIQGETGILEAL